MVFWVQSIAYDFTLLYEHQIKIYCGELMALECNEIMNTFWNIKLVNNLAQRIVVCKEV